MMAIIEENKSKWDIIIITVFLLAFFANASVVGETDEILQEQTREMLDDVAQSIEDANSKGVKVDDIQNLLEEAQSSFDKNNFLVAQSIAQQALDEIDTRSQKPQESSQTTIYVILGVIAGIIIAVLFTKIKSTRSKTGASSRRLKQREKLKAIGVKDGVVNVTLSKEAINVKLSKIIADQESYIELKVSIEDCEVVPLENVTEGYWHGISDGTGYINGLARSKIEGSGRIEGIIKLTENGKLYLKF